MKGLKRHKQATKCDTRYPVGIYSNNASDVGSLLSLSSINQTIPCTTTSEPLGDHGVIAALFDKLADEDGEWQAGEIAVGGEDVVERGRGEMQDISDSISSLIMLSRFRLPRLPLLNQPHDARCQSHHHL